MGTAARRPHWVPLIVSGAALVLACWAALALAAWWTGADPGHPLPAPRPAPPGVEERWENFAVFVLAASLLTLKAYLMWRRTVVWGALGASLIAANAVFAALYWYAAAAIIWPALNLQTAAIDLLPGGRTWPAEVRIADALRLALVLSSAWAIWAMARTPDPEDEADPWELLAEAEAALADAEARADRLTIENARLARAAGEP